MPRDIVLAPPKSTLYDAVGDLRKLTLLLDNGSFLGSEIALVAKLGVSRATVRQAARLLEREGLLRVRRGINGGYYAARPDAGTIEATVSAHLETLDVRGSDVTAVASVLWVEVVRRVATLPVSEKREKIEPLMLAVRKTKLSAPFADVSKVAQKIQNKIFDLGDVPYIRLIFQINVVFSSKQIPDLSTANDTAMHRTFVEKWREAEIMQLSAMLSGDVQLATMAARHMRNIWHQRLWC